MELRKLSTLFALASLAATLAAPVRAAIIDHGDFLADTATGLNWLDVTQSVNMSYSAVSSQFGAGGQFEGWRYATGDEFNALITNATGTPTAGNYGYINQEVDRTDALVALLGSTLDTYWTNAYGTTYDAFVGRAEGEAVDYTYGMLADLTSFGSPWIAMIYDGEYAINQVVNDYSRAHQAFTGTNLANYVTGSFLVRQETSIPEPSAIALLAIGLLGLGVSRRRARTSGLRGSHQAP